MSCRKAIIPLLSALMCGCSTMSSWVSGITGGEDNAEPPAALVEFEPSRTLEKIWETDTGVGSGDTFVNLVPDIRDGQIYVADREGRVTALDAASGEVVWSVETGAMISAGPGSGAELLLLGTRDGEVLALHVDTGEQLWKAQVSSEVLSVPQIDLDTVIVQTTDGSLAGLNTKDGSQRWSYSRTVPVLTLRGTGTPAVTRGLVLAGFSNGKLVALNAEKGFVLWESSIAIPTGRSELERIVDIDSSPVIFGDSAYVTAYQGQVAMVQLQDGGTAWERDMSSYNGLGLDFSQLYVADENSHVWALSRSSGTSVWKVTSLENRRLTTPVPFDEYVAVADFEGYLHLLSRYDGAFVARVQVDSSGVRARPVVQGHLIYVYGNSGRLVAYRLAGNN